MKVAVMFIVAELTTQVIYSDSPVSASDNRPESTTFQNVSMANENQVYPSMNDENSFIESSNDWMNRLNQQNRNMIEGDREMMQEGYDPNEVNPTSRFSTDPNLNSHWNSPNGKR